MKNAGTNRVSSTLAALAAVLGITCAIGSGPAAAQGTPEQQQACQPDALRLCSEFVPDVPSITKCMVRNRASLSPACRAVFSHPAPRRKPIRG